jgi:hypothetical protein
MAVDNTAFTSDQAKLDADTKAYEDTKATADYYNDLYEAQYAQVAGMPTGTDQECEEKLFAYIYLLTGTGIQRLEANENVTVAQMDVTEDITVMGNDIQNLTQTSDDYSSTALDYAAKDMDYMLNLFDPSNDSDTAKDVQESLGETTTESLSAEYESMRNDIYDPNDPAQTGTASSFTGAFYVDGDSSKYLTSYGEMYEDAALPDGELGGSEALDLITNSFSMISSDTQSLNASQQSSISFQSNLISQQEQGMQSVMKQEIDQSMKAISTYTVQ